MLQGYAITARLPEDPGFSDRFWYWRGKSGRNYIHSIYRKDCCPPLSEAVVVLVRQTGGDRRALGVGRIDATGQGRVEALPNWSDADEVHVHLLARDLAGAAAIAQDLAMALSCIEAPQSACRGFSEPVQLELICS